MKYCPHDYQKYAIDFILMHSICFLMLGMGLGKTVITLTALWNLLFDYYAVSKILVVAPKRVAENTWPAELAKWEHLSGIRFSLVTGSRAEREKALQNQADIYIISRDNVAWLSENNAYDFDMIVIDELSSFKSAKTQRFKALKKIRPKAKRVIGLSGTPGNLMDLWAEVGLLDMGSRLGRFIGRYREQFFVPDKRNRDIIYSYKPREGAEEKIYGLISDITISMKSMDYLSMPEYISTTTEVRMSETEQKLYETLEKDMILRFGEGEDIDAVNAAALSGKLHQMANGAVYDESGNIRYIHERKLDALEDMIEALDGKPLLVAYWFKHDRERLLKRFHARCIETAEDIHDWNTGAIPVALIHPASAGHGLNLQDGGANVVWFSLPWSLELYQQLNARVWRQGQRETVVIGHLVAKGTVDEDILKALERKDSMQEAMMAAVRARIGGYGNDGRDDVQRI